MSLITFSPNTKIKSADINSNFLAIQTGTEAANVAGSAWVPTFGGFSVAPTIVNAIYTRIGKTIFCAIDMVNGTSNATTFTITLPVAAKYNIHLGFVTTRDNSSLLTTPGRIVSAAGSAVASVYPDAASNTWTNVGTKNMTGSWSYEANT